MKYLYLVGGVMLLGLTQCGQVEADNCDQQLREIGELESQLFVESQEVQSDVRSKLMQSYAAFANGCHDHDETPEMLFRRADLLRSAGKFEEAMTQLRDIHDHYKTFDKRAVCAFLVGFIAEVELNDREQAKKTYQQVVELHPDSDAAEWARQSLKALDVN